MPRPTTRLSKANPDLVIPATHETSRRYHVLSLEAARLQAPRCAPLRRFGVLVALAIGLGCDDLAWEGGPSGLPIGSPAPSDSSVHARPRTPPSAAPQSTAVISMRARKLPLAPRDIPAQRITFARGRLGQLTDSALVIREAGSWQEVARVPVEKPRALTVARDGSFVAISALGILRFDATSRKISSYPRIPWFAGSLVFPDRLRPLVLWVLHDLAPALYQYDLEGSGAQMLAMGQVQALEDFDRRALVGLDDGSFLYTAGDQMRRFFPGGRAFRGPMPVPGPPVWRLLPTRRLDRVWVARREPILDLIQIEPTGFYQVRSLELPAAPFDLASNDQYLAQVVLSHRVGAERRWYLRVTDLAGKACLERELSGETPTVHDDWVERLTRNKTVILSRSESWVAVGGPERVTIWDIQTGKVSLDATESPPPRQGDP